MRNTGADVLDGQVVFVVGVESDVHELRVEQADVGGLAHALLVQPDVVVTQPAQNALQL